MLLSWLRDVDDFTYRISFQVPGYDLLRSSAASVVAQLQPMYDALVDAADLMQAAEELFQNVSHEWLEFSLSRNRGISLGLLEAMAWYMRVLLVMHATEERRVVAALHSLAYTTIHATPDPKFPS
jgi:lipoprotein signal peptidase